MTRPPRQKGTLVKSLLLQIGEGEVEEIILKRRPLDAADLSKPPFQFPKDLSDPSDSIPSWDGLEIRGCPVELGNVVKKGILEVHMSVLNPIQLRSTMSHLERGYDQLVSV